MQIDVAVHTITTYGGCTSIALVGSYLEHQLPSYGEDIGELEVHVYFMPRPTTEVFTDPYSTFITSLPNAKFLRAKKRFVINYLSRLGDTRVAEGFGPPKLDLFRQAAPEIVGELAAIAPKLKKGDAFDAPGFIAEMQRRLTCLPTTQEQFEALQAELKRARQERDAHLNPWDKLGVDWEDYHPRAREVLDDVFYWECADDFAPNGNDTGADVLTEYQEWRQSHRKSSVDAFFADLMTGWEVTWPAASHDEFSFRTHGEASIGLAFAQLKIDAGCEAPVRQRALEAIDLERQRMRERHPDWELLDERLKSLALLEAKLQGAPILPH